MIRLFYYGEFLNFYFMIWLIKILTFEQNFKVFILSNDFSFIKLLKLVQFLSKNGRLPLIVIS